MYGLLLSAPKVPFLNSALPEECPVCVYWRHRIDGSALSGLDEACPGAEPTPHSLQRCAISEGGKIYLGSAGSQILINQDVEKQYTMV